MPTPLPNKGREKVRRSFRAIFARKTPLKDDPYAITAPWEARPEPRRDYYQQQGRVPAKYEEQQ